MIYPRWYVPVESREREKKIKNEKKISRRTIVYIYIHCGARIVAWIANCSSI
jgi:hypothetical protein